MAILQFNGATEINQSSWMWTKIGELMDNRIFNLHLPVDILSKTEADDLYVAQRDLPIIALNGRATQYPSFFAPTYGGTAGYYLKSNGPSSTPTWAQIPVVTDFYWANVRISATEVVNAEPQFQSLALAKGNLYIGTPNEHSYITPGSHYNLSGIQEIWLEGLNLVYRDNESSGIQLNDHYITLFSPANIYSLRYFDEDGGQEIWNIDKNGKFSGTLEWSHVLNSPTIPQLSLNGVNRTLLNFYAPTAPGVAGQFLTSNGNNTAPSWTTLNLLTENDLPTITLNNNTTTTPTFFAPTTGGTSGQFLISNGDTSAPIWSTITIPSITLNNATTLYPSFYAPTTAGTSGYYLKSNGSGKAPTWTAFPSIPVVTDYYWANICISNQAKTNTTPVFQSLDIATNGHMYYGSPSDNSYISSSSAANDQTGLTITYTRDESSGIQFNGDYIVLFSPADSYCIRYFDEDGGAELWSIDSSSVFSGYIEWSHIQSKPSIPTITLNGSVTTTSATFYAPTSAGTSGYYLKSNGSGTPTWTSLTIPSINLNGTTKTNPTFYAPTSGGTSGYYLKSNGNSAPTWAEFPTMPTITLNDIIRTSPAFYAPTSGGTSGYYLKSNGNAAPTWVEFPFTLNGNKNDNPSIYAPITAGTTGYYLKSNGTGNAPTWSVVTVDWNNIVNKPASITMAENNIVARLNGVDVDSLNFYAPTTAGTSGYYLKSNGTGNAPTWSAITVDWANITNKPTSTGTNSASSLFCYDVASSTTQRGTSAFDFNNNLRLRATSEGLIMSIDKIQTSATNIMEPYIQWFVEGSIDSGPSTRDRCSACKIGLANINYINDNLKSYSLFMSFMSNLASTTGGNYTSFGSELIGIEWQIEQQVSIYGDHWDFNTITLKPTSQIEFSIGASDSPLQQIYSKAFTNTTSAADYAEKRIGIENLQPGTVVRENNLGILIPTIERLMPGAEVVSDTYGTILNATATLNNTPVAVAGLVLAIPYQAKENYKPGMAVCSAPNGTIDIMTREEIQQYPDCIVGIVSSIPDYETWGENNISVNNRIWIKVR